MTRDSKKTALRSPQLRSGMEALEARQVLSADGLGFGEILENYPAGQARAEEIASALQSPIDDIVEVELNGYAFLEAEFETVDDVDVFRVTTPALDPAAESNGVLNISSFAFSTGLPTIAAIGTDTGEPLFADISDAPFAGMLSLEVEPSTTYRFAVGQLVDPLVDPTNSDSAGPYQIDVSYFVPSAAPSIPLDTEPNTASDAISIGGDLTFGYLNGDADVDYFSYTAQQDGPLNVGLANTPVAVTELRIETSEGGVLASESAFLTPVETAVDVVAGETYFISVRSSDGPGGDYSLLTIEGDISQTPEIPADRHGDTSEEATDISIFGPVAFDSGVIDTPDDVDVFRHLLATETPVGIQLNGDASIRAELLDSGGNAVQTVTPGSFEVTTLPAGEIFLSITSTDASTPAFYEFFFVAEVDLFGITVLDSPQQPNDTPPVTTMPTDTVGNAIDTASPLFDFEALGLPGLWGGQGRLDGVFENGIGDVDVYSYYAATNAPIQVDVEVLAADSETVFTLLDADGAVVAEETAGTPMQVSIPAEGEYFVQIVSASNATTDYEVSVQLTAASPTEPITSETNPNANDPDDPTSPEEFLAQLGIDITNIVNSGDPDYGMDSDLNLDPTASLEELALLLGLDPDAFFDPVNNSTVENGVTEQPASQDNQPPLFTEELLTEEQLTEEQLETLIALGIFPNTVDPAEAPTIRDPDQPDATPEQLAEQLGLTADELAELLSWDPDVVPNDTAMQPEQTESPIGNNAPESQSVATTLATDAILGDIDGDNVVGFSDFLTMATYFGTEEGAEWQHGSFDGDGDVDFADFLVLSSQFGLND